MPKRSRSPKESKPIVVSLFERWNVDKFNEITQLVLKPETEAALRAIGPEINCKTTRRRTDYRTGKLDNGRVYSTGFQSVASWIRRLCAHEYYDEVDIQNAGPVLFTHVLKEHNVDVSPLIATYATDRDSLYDQIKNTNPELSDIEIKKLLLASFHGADSSVELLKQLRAEVRVAVKKLRRSSPKYSSLWKECMEQKDSNPTGRFVSCVWQELEHATVMHLVRYFQTVARVLIGALLFDGLMVEKHQIDLRAAEEYVLQASNVHVRLVKKSLTPTASDRLKLQGEKSLSKIKTALGRQLYLITRHAQVRGFKRRDGFILYKHERIPGVFVHGQSDLEFINEVLAETDIGKEVNMKKLIEWFGQVDSPRFELLTPSKMSSHVISFINGFFDINEMTFTTWVEFDLDKNTPPLTEHYFEQELDLTQLDNRTTPLWDTLLETQLGLRVSQDEERSPIEMLEILIGRCFYATGLFDNWQVSIFLRGDGATGKSTVLDLVKAMFPPASVGCITATHECHFGLEPLHSKRVVLIPDVPKHMSQLLAQSDFQSMVSGDTMSIARKNRVALCESWKPQLVFASNVMLDYVDNAGSVSRRLVVFSFTELIRERNTKLKEEIIERELVTILLRCIITYRQMVESSGSDDFWSKIAPVSLRELQKEVKQETCALAAFLANGDNYYQVILQKGAVTQLSELEAAYSNHMRFRHKDEKARLTSDHHAIKAAGYTVERLHLCKTCHFPCNKTTCGEHYNDKNRYRRIVIRDMLIKRV